ncbi:MULTISPECIES: hypothetical protein [unclassified Acidovorax]|uniref:hypothetical protein n=1 Tax=unclassified Acidovorax TaxID=2684926 RepID=UPI0028834938|nr:MULTISPECIES: hypothetical protein [unclassified Acidovorax]
MDTASPAALAHHPWRMSVAPLMDWLVAALRDIEAWLPAHLGVRLNASKTIIQPVDRGVDFVGQVIKPWRRTTRRRTLTSALQRLETLPASSAVRTTGNSYLGLVRQASHSHQERAQICCALLKRGHAVEGLHLSKTFRKAER